LPLPKTPVTAVDPSGHVEIDAQFGPTPHPRSGGSVWIYESGQLRRVPVVVGLQDDTWSELLSGDLKPGQSVVTEVTLPRSPRNAPASPFTPPRGNRGGFRR
jgi:multidrug efflux pump subunit AcrA (membrane-fusion protein)